jgi:hypothetical protein
MATENILITYHLCQVYFVLSVGYIVKLLDEWMYGRTNGLLFVSIHRCPETIIYKVSQQERSIFREIILRKKII